MRDAQGRFLKGTSGQEYADKSITVNPNYGNRDSLGHLLPGCNRHISAEMSEIRAAFISNITDKQRKTLWNRLYALTASQDQKVAVKAIQLALQWSIPPAIQMTTKQEITIDAEQYKEMLQQRDLLP